MLKHFEHVGMICSDMDKTVDFYCGKLGLRLHLRKPTHEGGEVAFLDAGGGMLEIVCPKCVVKTPAREVSRDEAGIRHVTFVVESVDAAYRELLAQDVTFTQVPRDAFNPEVVKRVAFCLDPDGMSVELVER